jgi:hypothetical protein
VFGGAASLDVARVRVGAKPFGRKVMREKLFMHAKYLPACGIAVALVLLVCSAGASQSGRRAPRVGSQTPTVETVQPAPQPETATVNAPGTNEQNVTRFKLFIATDLENDPSGRAATIYGKFFARLKDSPVVLATSLGVLKREEAVKRAKNEAESYVVWLDLEKDSVQGANIVINSPDYKVKYEVLAPGTAQVKDKGKVYFQAIGGPGKRRGDRWPSGTPLKITPEAAGEEAADMVLEWFMRLAPRPEQSKKQ